METERKFLVRGEFRHLAHSTNRIIQGYLVTDPERTVRIRISDNCGYITIKGKADAKGLSRFEWEKEIDLGDAQNLMKLCQPGIISKIRYLVKSGSHTFEVDVFDGDNQGLVIAEIELNSEDEKFERPEWLGEEVTGRLKYYNSMLTIAPFSQW